MLTIPFRRRVSDRNGPLAPTLGDRLGRMTRPGWARTDAARRTTAVVLVVAAGILLVRGNPDDVGEPVVVAARDLTPGQVLSDADLRTVDRSGADTPAGSVPAPDAALGRTVSSPVREGEILTDVRLLGPRLAEAAVGSADARIVPVRLSDSGLAALIREGDRVDVLTVDQSRQTTDSRPPSAEILASGATVVLVSPERSSGTERRDRVVMLALPAPAAGAVAAASLTDAITVTLH
ncbi:SAF domain-containing protein [Rhodococcus sp. AG1013]|uniref:SAF domain-containing protein n=1 Tax=unclassified Rhodococcus (in: high G+C Gram-positive bacteria) TaxID=192944 RepID=UPI000E0A9DA6|nr:RcpC/CpaB family pilus assembly protein [Rhodococcus sp. AG1013]RDI35668.1 Flp pilus assembly protein CpaB [Rhodococcus sp. AG1013]